MLIFPLLLACCKALALGRWWWRISDLRDEICSRCFSNAINEDTKQRDSEKYVEADTETEQETFSIVKPTLLLFLCERYTREVRLELQVVNVCSTRKYENGLPALSSDSWMQNSFAGISQDNALARKYLSQK